MSSLSKKEGFWGFLAFFAGAFILYGATLRYGFVWDDTIEILGNDVFHRWENLPKFFTTPYWTLLTGGFVPYHRPMIPVMILLVSTFFGKNPFGYHLLNLILYGSACGFYFLFVRRLPVTRWAAWMAAGLFLFHPAHVECAAWSSDRPVLLSGLCFVICLWLSTHLSNAQSSLKKAITLSLLALVYSVGLLSYHLTLTLLPVAFLYNYFFRRDHKNLRLQLWEYGIYLFLTAAFIIFCLAVFRNAGEMDLKPFYSPISANIFYTGAPGELFLAPINTFTRYAEILLFPLNLTPDAYFHAGTLSVSAIACFLIMIGITFAISKKHGRFAWFTAAWMILPLLTVANFVPQGGLFSDRYLYIASMGFALWGAAALALLRNQRSGKILLLLAPLIFAFYGFKSAAYSPTWKNNMRYWLEASILSPQKPRPHDKLGIELAAAGYLKEAAEEYRIVLTLDPEHFPMTHQRLAEVLRKLGQNEEAAIHEQKFQEAVKKAQEKGALLLVSN